MIYSSKLGFFIRKVIVEEWETNHRKTRDINYFFFFNEKQKKKKIESSAILIVCVYHHIPTDSLVVEQKVSRRSQKTSEKEGKKEF